MSHVGFVLLRWCLPSVIVLLLISVVVDLLTSLFNGSIPRRADRYVVGVLVVPTLVMLILVGVALLVGYPVYR